MALSIYKPGQGYWTRMLSAVGMGILVLAGAYWLWLLFSADPWGLANSVNFPVIYQQAIVAVLVIAGFALFGFWLFNHPRVVDFMIATEAEMKKVNWPGQREIVLSTWIVICGTLMMAVFLFLIDMLFHYLFFQIGILQI